ncbi:unnamed protein product [Ilex paraguariensis]|uniref:Uncharacterized protein n=1 Tax=Ilex paraguariensis TaxID=185542 RepID=A0ABC8SI42_9AQUA
MKKIYRKGSVHPTAPLISDHLSFLPATILTLTAALSPEDREVLAYLISCSSGNFPNNRRNTQKTTTSTGGGERKGDGDHPVSFNCYCFRCYMSYWVKWDASPNRQIIHEIIDAFEDGLLVQSKRERRKSRGCSEPDELKKSQLSLSKDEFGESESVEDTTSGSGGGGVEGCGTGGDDEGEEGFEKGSVRKFVSLLGERIWSVWT